MKLDLTLAVVRHWSICAVLGTSLQLVACGGGGSEGGTPSTKGPDSVVEPPVASQPQVALPPGTEPPPTAGDPPVAAHVAKTRLEAARFLTQATFGANEASIDDLMGRLSGDYARWIDEQLLKTPAGPAYYDYVVNSTPSAPASLFGLFWWNATYGQDQLRQRMAFALSQIFVTSADLRSFPEYRQTTAASYYGMLVRNAFSDYRTVLKDVTFHPYMGMYLNTLRNQKEIAGSVPDQNYAREVMQLFSIGLYQLNMNGTVKRAVNNAPLVTYNNQDIEGLSRVFTGLGWDKDDNFFSDCGLRSMDICNNKPMKGFPAFHSISEKRFLGIAIAARNGTDTAVNMDSDLSTALNRIANHSNVAPFIARRLIQQFVTSNPSRDYIERVAQSFVNNNGNLGQVIKAVLLDAEARDASYADRTDSFGKLREPVIRITNWLRAFELAKPGGVALDPSVSRNFEFSSKRNELCQYPMSAPSVFNFWRPGFVPNKNFAQANAGNGLVAPEMQVVHEVCSANYLRMLKAVVSGTVDKRSVNQTFGLTQNDELMLLSTYKNEMGLGTDALVARMSELMTAGRMSESLRKNIKRAVDSVPGETRPEQLRRAQIAVFLTISSSDYLVQK
jgi:uncharacterized protein (DUF1800 family)